MNEAIHLIAIIFILLGVGFVCRKVGFIDDLFQKKLSALVIRVAIPALLLDMTGLTIGREELADFGLFFLYGMAYHILFMIIFHFICKKVYPQIEYARISTVALTFTNCMFIGIPIVTRLFGEQYVLLTMAFVISFNAVLYTYGLYYLYQAAPRDTQNKLSLRDILLTPFNAALIVMLLFLFNQWKLPAVLAEAASMIAKISMPLGMLVIGSALATANFKQVLSQPKIYLISFLRLIVTPIAVACILRLLPIPSEQARAFVILIGLPAGANTMMLAEVAGLDASFGSMLVTQTTLFYPLIFLPMYELIRYLL